MNVIFGLYLKGKEEVFTIFEIARAREDMLPAVKADPQKEMFPPTPSMKVHPRCF